MSTTISEGAEVNIELKKGAKFIKKFIYQDATKVAISLASYKARMHIRKTLNATSTELELTTENGGITLEDAAVTGQIDLFIGATDTDALTISKGEYDFELYNPNDVDDVIRLFRGIAIVTTGVTR